LSSLSPAAAAAVHVPDHQAGRRRDWMTIALVAMAHAVSHFFQLVIPSLYVSLGAEFGLDFARLGLLASVFYVTSGLGQASSGFVVDRIGARPVLWFGLGAFVVSGVLLGTAGGYPMLLAAAFVGGAGNSVFHPVDFAIFNHRVSPRRLGHAFSAHGLTGNLGWALTPVFITTLTLLFGWRAAAFGAALVAGAALALTVLGRGLLQGDAAPAPAAGADVAKPAAPGAGLAGAGPAVQAADRTASQAATATQAGVAAGPGQGMGRAAPQAAVQSPGPADALPTGVLDTLLMLLRSPALWGAFLFFACSSLGMSAVQNYTIPLLGDLYGLSRVAASSALSGYMLASAFGMMLGGFLVSATPRSERVVGASLVFAGVSLVLLATGIVPGSLAIPAVAAAGLCAGVAGPSRDMLIRRVTPRGATGSVYGLVYCGMDVGAACGPLLFGLMLDAGLGQGPWLGAAAAFVLAAVLAALIARAAVAQGR